MHQSTVRSFPSLHFHPNQSRIPLLARALIAHFLSVLTFISVFFFAGLNSVQASSVIRPWQLVELTFIAEKQYQNPYTEVDIWIELKGPDFAKRIYGFWDGEQTFKIRFVATHPGNWIWTCNSNQKDDSGLNGQSGRIEVGEWTESSKVENPNRRGFLRASSDGHSLEYADGTAFFLVGDTWLAGSTWRLPFRNAEPAAQDLHIGPAMSFEEAVLVRKKQGFNSVSMIAAFPNWDADENPSTFADPNGIYIRNAWEKFGYPVSGGKGIDASGGDSYWGNFTAKSMRDERGNLPFEKSNLQPSLSDFDRINPDYFKSLDQKMEYLASQGFVPLLETIRRDVAPSWSAYFDFNESFSRYVQYLVARYGAYNFIFSKIHLDWIPEDFSITADAFNEALTYHLKKYGPMPYGQPVTVLINDSTYLQFGHGQEVPWLTMHSVGNKPRDHRISKALETQFKLKPPYPTINFEPYYTGWHHEINKPGAEQPAADSERDNYFSRAQMYGSVLSGGLSGHVHGTAAYDLTAIGEPAGARPHFWEAFQYQSANYMKHLRDFMLSPGHSYQQLRLAREDVIPYQAPDAPPDGLDGWSYMMRTDSNDFALLYFEHAAVLPALHGFNASAQYSFTWFNPTNGMWSEAQSLTSNTQGQLELPAFPKDTSRTYQDWAARLTLIN